MKNILCIETSSELCSVVLLSDGKIVAEKSSLKSKSHSSLITIFIEEVLKKSLIKKRNLSAIAVSLGPGSYTGLRIGLSVAKGLSYALNIPLIGINTLEILVQAAISQYNLVLSPQTILVPMIDARRMEVFTAIFDNKFNIIENTQAKIIDEQSYLNFKNKKIIFFGSGAKKCADIILNKNVVFLDDIYPTAKFMTEQVLTKIKSQTFENTAYSVPLYGKAFYSNQTN